jgi:hypothetical protein
MQVDQTGTNLNVSKGQKAGLSASNGAKRQSLNTQNNGQASQKATTKPKQPWDGTEELHKALRQSREIQETWSLYQFVTELKQRGANLREFESIDRDTALNRFLHSVILCTEAGYDDRALNEAVAKPVSERLAASIPDLLNGCIRELLQAGRKEHLQLVGQVLKEDFEGNLVLEPREINLNKTQFLSKNWEKARNIIGDHVFAHIYKDFLIFQKTLDHSLLQISGTNVHSFLSEKTGSKSREQDGLVLGAAGAGKDGELQFSAQQKADSKCHKYRLRTETDMYQLNKAKVPTEDLVSRTRLFYCGHLNRGNAFFRKHKINA